MPIIITLRRAIRTYITLKIYGVIYLYTYIHTYMDFYIHTCIHYGLLNYMVVTVLRCCFLNYIKD